MGQVIDFVLQEAERHPLLFLSAFSSLPIVFREYVLLLTWNLEKATIERLLNREQAYPTSDAWSNCLTAYRQATMLAYRERGPSILVSEVEVRRSMAVYRRLVSTTRAFLSALETNEGIHESPYSNVGCLLEETELAFAADDLGAAISRMEVLLSTVHKLILQYPPGRGPRIAPVTDGAANQPAPLGVRPQVDVPKDSRRTILVVDDDIDFLDFLSLLLSERGYAVSSACSAIEAMRTMVEHEFDLVITDMVMCTGADGREVALAAKRSSSKTRVIVFTGYPEMSRIADLIRSGVDDVLAKGFDTTEVIVNAIHETLSRPAR